MKKKQFAHKSTMYSAKDPWPQVKSVGMDLPMSQYWPSYS